MELEQINGNYKTTNRIKTFITHLLYADDFLFFLNVDVKSAYTMDKKFKNWKNMQGFK